MSHNTSVDHSLSVLHSHMRLETTRRASSVRRGRLAYEQCAGPLTTTTHTHRHPVLPSTNQLTHTHWRSFFLSHHHLASFDAGSHPAHTRFIRSRAVRSKQHVLEFFYIHTHTQKDSRMKLKKFVCLYLLCCFLNVCLSCQTHTDRRSSPFHTNFLISFEDIFIVRRSTAI